MDSLISKRSLDGFWKDTIMPLVLYQVASVKEILDMSMWEIQETLSSLKDEEWKKGFLALHGLQTK